MCCRAALPSLPPKSATRLDKLSNVIVIRLNIKYKVGKSREIQLFSTTVVVKVHGKCHC